MPDSRTNRGAHPKDALSFSANELPKLRAATHDLCWLLDRGYPSGAGADLVGNRYALRDRQRKAVKRCSASESDRSKGSRSSWSLERFVAKGWRSMVITCC